MTAAAAAAQALATGSLPDPPAVAQRGSNWRLRAQGLVAWHCKLQEALAAAAVAAEQLPRSTACRQEGVSMLLA
jgi:hypothetical protein